MRQAFLDSLRGLPAKEAKKLVVAEGHKFQTYENGVIATLLAKPNLVQLWLGPDGVTVVKASAGDPTELDTWVTRR